MICINIKIYNPMKKNQLLPNFKYLDYPEWGIQNKAGQIRVTNNFTHDQFLYVKCSQNTHALTQAYQVRSLYRMPLTPQIILSTLNNQYETEMLVEYASSGLEKLVEGNNCQTVKRQSLKKITNAIQYLIKKFGFFQITPKMIRATTSLKILIWINQDFSKMTPSLPLTCTNYNECCKIVFLNLISVFEKLGFCRKLATLKRRVELQKSMTFERFKYFIDANFKCSTKNPQLLKTNNLVPQFLVRDRLESVSVEKTVVSKGAKKQKLSLKKIQQHQLKQRNSPNKSIRVTENSRTIPILDKTLNLNSLYNYPNVLTSKRTASSSNLFAVVGDTSIINPEKTRDTLPYQASLNKKQYQLGHELKKTKKIQDKLAVSTYVDQFHSVEPQKRLKASQSAKMTLVQLETELNSVLLE